MTRQRDSDPATPSEIFEPPLINPSVHVLCSFCGNNTHGYTDCPVLQQYVRQQVNELADMWAREYYAVQAAASAPQGGPQGQVPQPRDDTRGAEIVSKAGKRGWQAKFGLPSGGEMDHPRGWGRGSPR